MMKRLIAMAMLAASITTLSAPARADIFQTATYATPSTGSYGVGSDGSDPLGVMTGAAFVISGGQFHMTGVGANFDGNVNVVAGQVQRLFVAIVSLGDGTSLPSFSPSAIAANALIAASFAPPTSAGDFTIPLAFDFGPGAYAAIFGSAGLFGSDAAGQVGLADGNTTIGTPNIFSNFGDITWSPFQFDTGIRIFEVGTVVPEPETYLLVAIGLVGLAMRRRARS